MKFLHKYGTRPNEIRRARKELTMRMGLVGAALLFFAVIILVTRFQPRLDQTAGTEVAEPLQESERSLELSIAALREQVDAVIKEYQARLSDGMDAMDGIDLLDRAIELQNEVIGSRTSSIAPLADVERLKELQTIKHQTMGTYLSAQSIRLENQAREAFGSGDFDGAAQLMERAIHAQQQINQQYPLSSSRDASRIPQLSKQLLEWQTKPMADRADKLRDEAYKLVEEGKYAEARMRIREALNEQQTLSSQYRQSRYATPLRMRSFEEAFREIDTREDVTRVSELVRGIEESLHAGDPVSALEMAEEAEVLQQGILNSLDNPSKDQTGLLASILMLKDTAAGRPAFQQIQSLRSATMSALRNQDIPAFQTNVAEWSRESTVFSRRFKLSRDMETLHLDEVAFLYKIRGDVPSIMEMVYGDLAPIAGREYLKLYQKEVSQALYESVTGLNPSSVKDPLKPVDSVTWREAVEFTGLLGKVLAKPLALPDRLMFLDALGETSLQTIREQSWASENSSRLVQQCGQLQANKAGFHDLLGNVAEWLAAESKADPDQVVAIGGSVRDSHARLAGVPEDWRSPDERNRFIGFRFIVDDQDVSK